MVGNGTGGGRLCVRETISCLHLTTSNCPKQVFVKMSSNGQNGSFESNGASKGFRPRMLINGEVGHHQSPRPVHVYLT